jgi:hypothetical protein
MPTTEARISHKSIRHGRRRRRWVGRIVLPLVLVLVGGAGYLAFNTFRANFGEPSCRAMALGRSATFTPEQSANAATITAIALKRGLPARAATIANATAIVESKLRNLKFGDRDSLGLFQQRPSQGWGTEEQILDPVYATNKFYDALIKVNGYQSMEITKVAQAVQKSGFPQAYADHEDQGRILASTLTGHSPGGIGCRLDAATSDGDDAVVLRVRHGQYPGSNRRRPPHRRAGCSGHRRRTYRARPGPQPPGGLGCRLLGRGARGARRHRRRHCWRPRLDPGAWRGGLVVAGRQQTRSPDLGDDHPAVTVGST